MGNTVHVMRATLGTAAQSVRASQATKDQFHAAKNRQEPRDDYSTNLVPCCPSGLVLQRGKSV